MSQDQKNNRVGALSGPEAKTPLDRANQIREMQAQMDSMPIAPAPVKTPAIAPEQAAQAAVATNLQKMVETFDARPVEAVSLIKNEGDVSADAQLYGAKQVDESSLFGVTNKGSDIDIKGNPWKVIPFGPPQVAALIDVKKPIEQYDVQVPQNAVRHKEGALFQLTAKPKTGNEAPIKKAVLVDDKGGVKGAEFKSKIHLERALTEIPSFAMNLFQSVFGDGVQKDMTKTHHRVASVEVGKRSAYEVKIERKNEIDGKWRSETVTLNNFGLKVPPANDPRRHDINVAMYYLDRFSAA